MTARVPSRTAAKGPPPEARGVRVPERAPESAPEVAPERVPEVAPEVAPETAPQGAAPVSDALAQDVLALLRDPADEAFDFLLHGGQGFILDFEQGRDVINLSPLGLTPWDLLPSINGPDLVLAFDGGEVVLRGCAGVHLSQWDFRY
jgi:hypothetical protein